MKNSARIQSLNGLKVIAVLLIFWQHCILYRVPIPDQAARAVEIFFVISGFLTAHNHLQDDFSLTWGESLRFAAERAAKFYPVHLISFLMYALFISGKALFAKKELIRAFLNLILMQSWSTEESVYFSFNGSSWYLSSFLFCCFLTPLLLTAVKKAKRPMRLFALALLLRLMLSYLTMRFSGEFFRFNTYTFPPSRCLEYFMGIAIYPLFSGCSSRWEDKKGPVYTAVFSAAELLTMALAVRVFFLEGGYWFAPLCVLAISIMIFTLSFGRGVISALLSLLPFRAFSKIQLEFFMFHVPVLYIFHKFLPDLGSVCIFSLSFAVTVFLSVLYHRFLSIPLSEKMRNLLVR